MYMLPNYAYLFACDVSCVIASNFCSKKMICVLKILYFASQFVEGNCEETFSLRKIEQSPFILSHEDTT